MGTQDVPAENSREMNRRGVTLVELMVAVTIFSVGILAFMGGFTGVTRAIQKAKTRTLSANPLTMERMEVLKQTSYYRLLATTAPATAPEPGLGSFPYDTGYYPPETQIVGGLSFTRRVLIEKVAGNPLVAVVSASADTGIKRITVYTIWQEEGDWKKYEARSLLHNPTYTPPPSTIKGNVDIQGTATNITDVRVEVFQNANWFDLTDAGGDYSIASGSGTFSLRATKFGYHTYYSANFDVPAGAVVTQNFEMIQIASGTVTGSVWFSTNIVISQVVASTGTYNSYEVEYVELYNPTTYTWTLGASNLELRYRERNTGPAETTIPLTYNVTTLPASGYYLIASTTPVAVLGGTRAADAVYTKDFGSLCTLADPNPCTNTAPNICDCITDSKDGGIGIRQGAAGPYYDRVAWSNSTSQAPPDELKETVAIELKDGLEDNEQIVRMTSTGSVVSSLGNAYDTDYSTRNFFSYCVNGASCKLGEIQVPELQIPPRNTAILQIPVSGRPAFGAVVTASDGLSRSTQALTLASVSQSTFAAGGLFPYASFTLQYVATGTWVVSAASVSYYLQVATVTMTSSGQFLQILSTTTIPNWPYTGYYALRLTSSTDRGFVAGTVRDVDGNVLPNITVKSSGGSTTSGGDGQYRLSIPSGTVTVDCNPSSDPGFNSTYVSASSAGVVVNLGQFTSGVNFNLSKGGGVRGWVTINGVDALPDVVVAAEVSGVEVKSTISGSDGYYAMTLSTGSYDIKPKLDTGEIYTPEGCCVAQSVTVGTTLFVGTFTVSGAFGNIVGSLTSGGVAINTGVLLVATTGTITSDPPLNNSTLRGGGVIYYGASSLPDGTYKLPVRGNATAYNVYGWYAPSLGAAVQRRSGSAPVSAGGTVTVNLVW